MERAGRQYGPATQPTPGRPGLVMASTGSASSHLSQTISPDGKHRSTLVQVDFVIPSDRAVRTDTAVVRLLLANDDYHQRRVAPRLTMRTTVRLSDRCAMRAAAPRPNDRAVSAP
jgi:hypothetical protein